MAAASPLPDIGPRGGGDDGSRGGGDSESECSCSTALLAQPSCADTNASGIRGDPDAEFAIEAGEIILKPAPFEHYAVATQDGVVESEPQERTGFPGKFGVLCGNWGGQLD